MPKQRNAPPADHLSGKRRWIRQPRALGVVCVGVGTTIRARTIDISRGGMLVEADDGDVPPIGQGELVPLAFLVAVAFRDGMKAVLAPEVSVRAEVVRVTTSPLDRRFLRLGCRFQRTLTRKQCAVLGIDEKDVPDPALDLGRTAEDGAGEPAAAPERIEVAIRPDRRKAPRPVDPKLEQRADVG